MTEELGTTSDTFLLERAQGDVIVQRVLCMGTEIEILERWEILYPNDELNLFPCDVDENLDVFPAE